MRRNARPSVLRGTLTGRYLLLVLGTLVASYVVVVSLMSIFMEPMLTARFQQMQIETASRFLSTLESDALDDLTLERVVARRGIVRAAWWAPRTLTRDAVPSGLSESLMAYARPGTVDAVAAEFLSMRRRAIDARIPNDAVMEIADDARDFVQPMVLSLLLANDRRLTVVTEPVPTLWPLPMPLVVLVTLSALTMAVVAVALAGRVARPFRELTEAADRLRADEPSEPLQLSPLADIRHAQQAFNSMSARLRSLLAAQRGLLAAIGHDLRTPLTSLRLRTALVSDVNERVRMIAALDELQQLMDAALDAATGTSGGDAQRFDLGSVVSVAVEEYRDSGASVELHESDTPMLVDGWPQDLVRATRNLVENALRFGGKVTVRCDPLADVHVVRVLDDGPGIPQEELERVFEPLVRLETSRHASTGGRGLGLHLVRQIVASHLGSVRLVNRKPGPGLEAIVTLPRADSADGGIR